MIYSRNDALEGKVGVPWHGFESRTYSFLSIVISFLFPLHKPKKIMIKIFKRWNQRRKINKINQQLESLSWNMQFEALTPIAIKWHNERIAKLRMLRNIEEGLLEAYC